jgi:hypothetical protein
MVPGRLARNRALGRWISADRTSILVPGGDTPAMTVPIEKVEEILGLIAKGLRSPENEQEHRQTSDQIRGGIRSRPASSLVVQSKMSGLGADVRPLAYSNSCCEPSPRILAA